MAGAEDSELAGDLSDSAAAKGLIAEKPRNGTVSIKGTHFVYRPAKDSSGDDHFLVELTEGKQRSQVSVTVHVTPENDAPVAKPATATTPEDVPAQVSIVASDVDGDALEYSLQTAPAHGEATIDAKSGKLVYTPALDFNGPDALVVAISDGALIATSSVSLTVIAVNDSPVASSGAATLDEDGKVEGQLVAADVDATPLTYTANKKPKHGDVSVNPRLGTFTYTPVRDFHGADEFSFAVSDGQLAAQSSVALTVTSVNDAPTAKPLALTTNEDQAVKGAISASDIDAEALTYSVKNAAAHGEAVVEAQTGRLTYTPAANFNGADTFVVEVSDGALSALAEVKVTVNAVNDAPLAQAASFTLDEDTKLDGSLVGSDVETVAITYRVAQKPKHGELAVVAATGAFTYTPARDFHGADDFTFEVSDSQLVAQASVSLTIKAVNDVPVSKPLALSTAEDTVVKGAVVASDVDGDGLTYSIRKPAAHGEASVDAKSGRVSYSPALDSNGPDGFAVEVSDGVLSTTAEVAVTVSAVNDAPVAQAAAFSVDEDTKLEGQVPFSDVEHDALTVRVDTKPKHGELTLNAQTGAFTYTPARDYHGPDAFLFDVSDNQLKSALTTVNLTVAPVNDAPVIRGLALTTAEDVAVRGSPVASDVDHDVLTYRVSKQGNRGQATVDPKSGAAVYQPAADANGVDSFELEVSDGTATATCLISVNVTAVPDAPRVSAATLEAQEDAAADGALPGVDPDGDRRTFHLLSSPRLGSAVLVDAATGAWRFTPTHDLFGDDEIAFDVSDGTTTVKGTMKIHIAPVNDAPLLSNLELKTIEDRSVEGQLVGSDVDRDALTYSVINQPTLGRATVDAATGKVRFEPLKDQFGEAVFAVLVSDGQAKSEPATVHVVVEPQNDAPVASNAALVDDEDVIVTGAFKASDVDNDALVFTLSRPPAHGSVTITDAAKGTYAYTPAPNYSGRDEFRFAATDPSGASSIAVISLDIHPVNDAPVAMSDRMSAPSSGSVTGRLTGYDRESRRVTFRIVEQPASGKVVLTDETTGDFILTTDGVSENQVEFRFVVSDGSLTSDPADLIVQIHSRSF